MRTSIKNHPRANEAMVAEDLSQSRQEDALEAGKSRQKVEGYSDNHKVRWYQTSAWCLLMVQHVLQAMFFFRMHPT